MKEDTYRHLPSARCLQREDSPVDRPHPAASCCIQMSWSFWDCWSRYWVFDSLVLRPPSSLPSSWLRRDSGGSLLPGGHRVGWEDFVSLVFGLAWCPKSTTRVRVRQGWIHLYPETWASPRLWVRHCRSNGSCWASFLQFSGKMVALAVMVMTCSWF